MKRLAKRRSACERQAYLTQEVAENTARLLLSKGIKAFAFRCCVGKHFHVERPSEPITDDILREKKAKVRV